MELFRCISGLTAVFLIGGTGMSLAQPPPPPKILRFVEGIDSAPVPMPAADVAAQLNDPWATLVLRKNVFPTDLTAALAALDPAAGQTGYSSQQSFFVSESGQLPLNVRIAREFRLVVTRGKPTDNLPDVLMAAPAGQRAGFIELMSWDPIKKAFNFYRRPIGGQWTWNGDTRDAFRSQAAGNGCFRCHVHGAPIMKEMRPPWNNWHSQSASIPPEAIPSLEIRNGPLFKNKSEGQKLEPLIRGWESQAAIEQVKDRMRRDSFDDAPRLLTPLFVTDTVNLQSSQQRSSGLSKSIDLPGAFFLNFDVVSTVLGLETSQTFSGLIDRSLYTASLTMFDFSLSDNAGFTQKGDTHFGFLVPVAAESGTQLVRQLVAQQVISRHFAISVQTLDFANPVYSSTRESLLKYVPQIAHVQDGRSDLAERTAQAIVTAATGTPAGSPERQFATNWNKAPDQLRADAEKQIKDYENAVLLRLTTQDAVNDYTRLAESRRRRFSDTALDEFPLLLPRTNLPANVELRMRTDGTVGP